MTEYYKPWGRLWQLLRVWSSPPPMASCYKPYQQYTIKSNLKQHFLKGSIIRIKSTNLTIV